MRLEDVKPYLNNFKRRGGQYTAQCPICLDDSHLYVKGTDDNVLMYCQKCNAKFPEIIKALNIPQEKKASEGNEIKEKYDHIYRNPDGTQAYGKTRIKYMNGKKQFSFFYVVDGQKVYKKPKECNNLYNLDLLEKANSNEILYIVEGEKCADALTRKGFLATTTNGGAGGKMVFTETDIKLLEKFQTRVVIPDNDEAGQAYIKLFPGAEVLNLIDIWPQIELKQDVADYLIEHDGTAIKEYSFKPINELDYDELVSPQILGKILSINDAYDREIFLNKCKRRAQQLNAIRLFESSFKQYKISINKQRAADGKNKTQFNGQELILNCNDWTADDYGVYKLEITQANGAVKKYASLLPILPTEILFNLDTLSEKIKIEFYKNNRWQSCICDRSTTASASKIIELANLGIEVNSENAKLLVKYIADCVGFNLDTIPRYKSVSRMGWLDKEFMPYNTDIKFDGEKEYKHLHKNITSKGDLKAWCEYVQPLRKVLALRMTMASGLASPLLKKVNALPFVFHLWGGTGSGKTVALMVAMSIWGDSRLGKLVKTMNMTTNSMMGTAAFLCNLPFAGDELQTIKKRGYNYDGLIMRVCEGVDRGRMSYDKVNDTKTWKCSFLFTGEEPCTQFDSGGGTKNRVIEHECADIVVANGNEVVRFLEDNYGLAGPEYIKALAGRKLSEEYSQIFQEILITVDTTEKQAMALAAMMLSDKIAGEIFFPTEKPLTMDDIKAFALSKREIQTDERAYSLIINIVAKNINKFDSASKNPNEVWGKVDGDYVYINKDVLTKELSANGFEFEAVKRNWADKGYLIKNSQGRMVHQTKVCNIKASYIKLKNVNTDDESNELPY